MKMLEKKKILVVDDTEINRSILSDMLCNDFEIIEANDGIEGIANLHEHEGEIALVLLDIVMPNMDGFEMLQIMNDNRWIETIPVIMISAETYPDYIERAYDLGVVDYINRPFDGRIVLRRVLNTIMLYTKQKKLMKMVEQQVYEKEKNNDLMVEILSHIVEFRNGESGAHVLHIRTLTELLLKSLVQRTDKYHLSDKDIHLISNASALHDIGKIAIAEDILNKPAKLTPEEFEIIKTHTVLGERMLDDIMFHEDEPLLHMGKIICRSHHERYDGFGYPDGLKGDEIPIGAQVVSIADVYDALSSERVYKPAYSHEKTMEMILGGECGVFNPLLIECLSDISEYIKQSLSIPMMRQMASKSDRYVYDFLTSGNEYTSQRTLRLLEHERIKYQFFASMSHEVQFEYTRNPDMIVFNAWGARYLGIDEVIMNPLHNEAMIRVFSSATLMELHNKCYKINVHAPILENNYQICVEGELRWHKLTARTLWNDSDGNQYLGMIGKIVDIQADVEHLTRLEKRAEHDDLTSLYNRRYASEYISKSLKKQEDKSYALILFDLDNFKNANDQHGHLFGDSVLKEEAMRMQEHIGSKALLSRVGGDEFMIFMECKRNDMECLNKLFHALIGDYQGFSIHISMGVAFCKSGDDYETIFHHADQALYYSKKKGKNKYSIYDEKSMKGFLSVLSSIDEEIK